MLLLIWIIRRGKKNCYQPGTYTALVNVQLPHSGSSQEKSLTRAEGSACGVLLLFKFIILIGWFLWKYSGVVDSFTSPGHGGCHLPSVYPTASSRGGAVSAKQGQEHAFLFPEKKILMKLRRKIVSVVENPVSCWRCLAGPAFYLRDVTVHGINNRIRCFSITLGAYIFFNSVLYWTFELHMWSKSYKRNDNPMLLGRILPDLYIFYLWAMMWEEWYPVNRDGINSIKQAAQKYIGVG